MSYPIHSAAGIMPRMSDEELRALASDIKKYGLREPIRVLDGQIIDGRHRQKACEMTGVRPVYLAVSNSEVTDTVEYVLGLNVKRRMLTKSQLAIIATGSEITGTDAERAERFGISRTYITLAKSVRTNRHLTELVFNGEMSLRDAKMQIASARAASARLSTSTQSSHSCTELEADPKLLSSAKSTISSSQSETAVTTSTDEKTMPQSIDDFDIPVSDAIASGVPVSDDEKIEKHAKKAKAALESAMREFDSIHALKPQEEYDRWDRMLRIMWGIVNEWA